jgi:hypothetical protein
MVLVTPWKLKLVIALALGVACSTAGCPLAVGDRGWALVMPWKLKLVSALGLGNAAINRGEAEPAGGRGMVVVMPWKLKLVSGLEVTEALAGVVAMAVHGIVAAAAMAASAAVNGFFNFCSLTLAGVVADRDSMK